MALTPRQKQLQKLIKRRHPLYEEMVAHWQFLSETYEGGRAWFDDNIFRYIKEGPDEYAARVRRAYRFNHTREVVDLVTKYLFKQDIARSEEVPQEIKDFWANATLQGQPIREYMRSVATRSSAVGRVWLVVDSTKTSDAVTKADEKAQGARVYSYIVDPVNMLDVSYDEQCEIVWCLVREYVRDDTDPFTSSGALEPRYRLWTRAFSQVIRVKREGTKIVVLEEPPVEHGLGVVPVIPADHVLNDEKWTSPAMVADVAYLDRACANYLSNLDAIIQDQTFSQLAMPAQGVAPGTDAHKQLVDMGTKRIFTYDGGDGNNAPFFLSPDVKQAQLILEVVNKIINEIYHSVGLAGERTKEDNSQGIDNSSGVAKAYDFERVNSLLASKADAMEAVENRLVAMVARYSGVEAQVERLEKPAVLYPDNFDVRGLYDEFEIATRLALVDAPDEIRRQQMAQVIDKLFPQLKEDLKQRMLDELKSWPPKLLDTAGADTGGPSSGSGKRVANSSLTNKLAKSD